MPKTIEEFKNRIICGDCLEVLKEIPDKSIDLCLSDPPYGANFVPFRKSSKEKFGECPIENDDKLGEDLSEWLLPIFKEVYRVLKNNTVFFAFCGFDSYYMTKPLIEAGFVNKARLVWVKNYFGVGYHFRRQHEDCIVGFKGTPPAPPTAISDVIFSKRASNKTTIHSCEKPIDVLMRLIPQYADKDAIVLDPFSGSGSTCLAAKMLNRNYIGIEIEKKYCDLSEKRLIQVQDTLFK